MLLEFGAQNFCSFREGFEISLRLGKSCPDNISNGKCFSNTICVKGANASGKTNALKVLSFIGFFCSESFSAKPNEKLFVDSFYDSQSPTSFFLEFSIDDIEYRYELSLDSNVIYSEKLFRRKGRMTPIIERTGNEVTNRIKEFSEIDSIKLRANASIISTAHQYELSSLTHIYDFFDSIIANVGPVGLHEVYTNIDDVSEYYYETEEYFAFVKEIIKKCDLGISDIVIENRKDEDDNNIYVPFFIHEVDNKPHKLHFGKESSGTRNLYKQLFRYKITLDLGGILVMDEFDINLHPDILPLLVDLFENEQTNPLNAQLIFTTHSENILNKMGKYRCVLVNKEGNESFLYRLDEIPGDIIRNDRPIEPIYRSGKIGGVPKV